MVIEFAWCLVALARCRMSGRASVESSGVVFVESRSDERWKLGIRAVTLTLLYPSEGALLTVARVTVV
jgi:hypothetical protein